MDKPINSTSPNFKLVVPSLFVATYAAQIGGVITSLLLIDIGETFNISVGIAGQIKTISSSIAVIISILMGVLSQRYSHKRLLMIGLSLFIVSSLGNYLSPSFNLMLTFSALSGIGIAVYGPMSTTIIGEVLPTEKRAGAIGVVVAAMSFSYLMGALIVSYLSGVGGWRTPYLLYSTPISLLGLIMVSLYIPSRNVQADNRSGNFLEGFKAIFSNRSANSCLFCYVLASAAWQYSMAFSASFVRQRFFLSTSSTAFFMLGAALLSTAGSIFSGRLINRFGRKKLTVTSILLLGILTVISPFLYNLTIFVILGLSVCVFAGLMLSGIRSLTLEQVPRFRGTMMSLNYASMQMGYALGAGLGGFLLVLYDYQGAGSALGILGIIGALLLHLYSVDPLKK